MKKGKKEWSFICFWGGASLAGSICFGRSSFDSFFSDTIPDDRRSLFVTGGFRSWSVVIGQVYLLSSCFCCVGYWLVKR